MVNCPGTTLLSTVLKQGKRKKTLTSRAHVLEGTQNLVISRCCFAEDGKEMYQNEKRTCRAIVFAH